MTDAGDPGVEAPDPAVSNDDRGRAAQRRDGPGDEPGELFDVIDSSGPGDDDRLLGEPTSHRGGFGELGGESAGLIDRTFRERIVIVGMDPTGDAEEVDRSLDELALLVDTAGADVLDRVVQRRSRPDPATYLGSGKVTELRELCEDLDIDTVVFDDELSPGQQFNLERLLGRTALDRTAVILDIFAQNASTTEGKLQVELAQLRYRLPRIRGKGQALSQQSGRIGTRGPGETQLEVDRRRLQRRVHKVEAALREVNAHRDTQRKARRRSRLAEVAIVGYTNAGKSTLLNRLTDAGVLVEDRLFATLDATTRRMTLPGGESVLVTDTVGFITKLPHGLVEAFRSTLELVRDADLAVHVVDASAIDPDAQIEAVRAVLDEIGADEVPELLVANKADLDAPGAAELVRHHPGAVVVSARTGEGIDDFLAAVGDRLRSLTEVVELVVPYGRGDVMAALHREGEVLVESTTTEGMRYRARVEPASVGQFDEFVVGD